MATILSAIESIWFKLLDLYNFCSASYNKACEIVKYEIALEIIYNIKHTFIYNTLIVVSFIKNIISNDIRSPSKITKIPILLKYLLEPSIILLIFLVLLLLIGLYNW